MGIFNPKTVSVGDLFAGADVILQVRTFGANPEAGRADLAQIRSGQVLIGASDPLTSGPQLRELAGAGATLFAMELIPRIRLIISLALPGLAVISSKTRTDLTPPCKTDRPYPII